jgi:hypothetical protein
MIKQVKSHWYYVFWGAMTAIVFTGQLVTASGYVKMSNQVSDLMGVIEESYDSD